MALYGDITYDSRVQREATALAEAGHIVRLVCLAGEIDPVGAHPNVELLLRQPTATSTLPGTQAARAGRSFALLGRLGWLAGYVRNLRMWGRLVIEAAGPVDAWHLHDLPGLAAVGPRALGLVPVVYDAHEIFIESGTAQRLPTSVRSLLRRYEARLVSRATALVTVNDDVAGVLGKRYRPRRSIVVHNCPDRWLPGPAAVDHLRLAAGIPPSAPVILYHGAIGPERGIEQLAASLLEPGIEQAHLVLLGPSWHADRYRAMAADPRWGGRMHVLEPVAPGVLLEWVRSADVGGVLIQPTTLNHRLSTPNKLFECLAAGVPVVASNFPSMARIVLADPSGPLGVLCDPGDPGAAGNAIRSILELGELERADLRRRCLAAAHDRWNWESEVQRLTAFYGELAATGPRAEQVKDR